MVLDKQTVFERDRPQRESQRLAAEAGRRSDKGKDIGRAV